MIYDTGVNDQWWKIEEQDYDYATNQYGIITTYYDDGARSRAENDLQDNQWYESVTYWFDARGYLNLQTGVYYNSDTWTSSIANGHVQSWTTFDGGFNDSWSKIEYKDIDVSTGNWGIISTTNDDGTHTDAYSDLNHTQWYESATNWFDANGNFYVQSGVADNGDSWVAKIDHGEIQSWTVTDGGASDPWSLIAYSNRDSVTNQWMVVSTTYDDGTHADAYSDLNHT